jgi:hypothetical protein
MWKSDVLKCPLGTHESERGLKVQGLRYIKAETTSGRFAFLRKAQQDKTNADGGRITLICDQSLAHLDSSLLSLYASLLIVNCSRMVACVKLLLDLMNINV